MNNTIPLPPHVGEEYHGPSQSPVKLYDADQLHAHAAAVSAAKDAEIAGLRDELLREHADHKETIEDAATVVHQNTALRERIKVLEDALRAADAAFEAVEIFMPGGCKEEFAFYADWEDVRSALGDKTPTTQPPSPSPRS